MGGWLLSPPDNGSSYGLLCTGGGAQLVLLDGVYTRMGAGR